MFCKHLQLPTFELLVIWKYWNLLGILKIHINFLWKRECCSPCSAVMFWGTNSCFCACSYSSVQDVPGYQSSWCADGCHVLNHDSEIGFFPSTYQLSWFLFQIRRKSCVPRRAGLGKHLVRASLQERVTWMWNYGAQTNANKILPLRNFFSPVTRSFTPFWNELPKGRAGLWKFLLVRLGRECFIFTPYPSNLI